MTITKTQLDAWTGEVELWRDKCKAQAEELEAAKAALRQQVALVEKCMIAMNENADRGQKAELERDALQADAKRFKGLRELCGYLQDGSDITVKLMQDDATRTFIVAVGEVESYGPSLGTAIDAAMAKDTP